MSDLDCDLTQVCRSLAKVERALLRPRPDGVCVRDTVDPTATLLGMPLYVGPRSDRDPQDAVWVTGELWDNRWVEEAWFELDGLPLQTKFVPGGEIASADVSGVRLGPDGPHTLMLWVRDAAGHLGSATGVVIKDARAPKVDIVAESPDGSKAVLSAEGLVFGTPNLRAGVRVEERNPAQVIFETPMLSYFWPHVGAIDPQLELRDLTLSEGQHHLGATVTDAAGNVGTDAATIRVDLTPPVVTSDVWDGLTIQCGDATAQAFNWSIHIEDATATTIEVSAGSRLGRGSPWVQEIITDLELGKNIVTVLVTDEAGHQTELVQRFTVVPDAHWRRNTFPGPGHLDTVGEGPWERGEGTDRAEYITAFGISPLDGNFMLMGTDVAGLTVARDGRNFVSANLPVNNVSHIAFDPLDASTAYVWARNAGHQPTLSGWWRTTDLGRSWRLMLSEADGALGIEDIGGALNPFHVRPLAVASATDGGPPHILVGTVGNGLLRSTDGGVTFSELAPGPGHFAGKTIRTISRSADGSAIYMLVADAPEADAFLRFTGKLWVFFPETGDWADPQPAHRFEDVEVSPLDPGAGFLVRTLEGNGLPTRLHRFASHGASLSPNIDTLASAMVPDNAERGDVQTVRVNPWNADHVVVTRRGTRLPWLMQWSTDGGESWHAWDTPEDGIMREFTDYAPLNHLTADYGYRLHHVGEVFDPTDGTYLESPGVDRGRWPDLIAFLPYDPQSVAIWGPTSGLKAPLLSRDYGATFSPFGHGGTFKRTNQVVVSNGDQALAVARTEYGVVASDDGGAAWRGSGHINQSTDGPTFWPDGELPRDYRSRTAWGVGVSPDGRRMVAVVGDQVFDWNGQVKGGAGCGNEKENTCETSCKGQGQAGGSCVVGDCMCYDLRPAVVMLSTDRGRTWARKAMALKKTHVFWHRQKQDVVYAGGLVSEDGGESWANLSPTVRSDGRIVGREVVAMSETDGDLIVFLRSEPVDREPPMAPQTQMRFFLSDRGPESVPGALTEIPDPPEYAFEDSFLIHPNFIAIDPSVESNPEEGTSWRLLMAGTEGIYTYTDENGWVASGTESGLVSLQKHEEDGRALVVFLNKVAFDPRPGHQHRVYAASGGHGVEKVTSTPESRSRLYPWLRGTAPYRQLYRSDDGGVTWSRMHGDCVTGLPDYLDVQALAVSADTGRLFVHAWSGLYVLDVDGVDESYEARKRGWTATVERGWTATAE